MAISDPFYQELIPEIDSIIDEFGTEFELSSPGEYDEATMRNGPPITRVVGGVIADQSIAISVANMAGSGLSSDATWMGKRMLILKQNAEPKPTESVIIDGLTYPLTSVVAIRPAEVTVVYMLDITR